MSLLEKTIGWLAPSNCLVCGAETGVICYGCQQAEIFPFGERCFSCNKVSNFGKTCPSCKPSSPTHVWISAEYSGVIKELVQSTKFHHQRSGTKAIAEIMAECLTSYFSEKELVDQNFVLVPVPTATKRIRERSFDHTLLIAKELGARLGLEVSPVARRLGQSRQVGAKRSVRLEQLKDSFYINKSAATKGRKILLIDDVVTTGASLKAVTRVARQAGAKSVDALVFAKRIY